MFYCLQYFSRSNFLLKSRPAFIFASSLKVQQRLLTDNLKTLSLKRRLSSSAAEPTAEDKQQINFSDFRTAFKEKRTSEIFRALFVLQLCSYDIFVNNSLKLMVLMQNILGETLFSKLVRPTFYNQFVGGDNAENMTSAITLLQECNVQPMIACMMEDDIKATLDEKEKEYDNNFKRIVQCIQLLGEIGKQRSALQVKLTGLLPTNILVKLNQTCQHKEEQIKYVDILADCLTTGVFKSSPLLNVLDDREKCLLEKGLQRLNEIGKASKKCSVIILVDAEYVSVNDSIKAISLAAMKLYNKNEPFIWDTIQCYLKDAYNTAIQQLNAAKTMGFCYGVKFVRGAYMEQERQLAKEKGYPDPINDTYNDTGIMYNRVVEYFLQQIAEAESTCKIIIATHNEDSIQQSIKRLKELTINTSTGTVSFAQLYGMCDQVTIPLSKAGYDVYKSVPYGTLSEVLPYLYRRATENRAILQGARKEKELLWKEMSYRLGRRKLNSPSTRL